MESDPLGAVFAALAHQGRRRMLDVVKATPGCNVNHVASHFEMSRIAVMKHLRVLADAHLVVTERAGRTKLHYLNAVPIREIHDRWIAPYREPVAAGLLALRDHVEGATT